MDSQELRDDQWQRIEPFVPGGRKGKRGPRSNNRQFINALLWLARSGARWRDMPERFGPYQTIKRRYYRWIEAGIISDIFESLTQEADFEWIQIDATVIRAHKHAAGAPRKKGGLHPKAWGVQGVDIQQSCTPQVMV